jgi:SagB-type dehydrogenase family enzyme
MTYGDVRRITLPPAQSTGDAAVEEALRSRRSVRDFADEPLSLAQVSQLLWAAQGITSREGFRTAPSAGALYPLEAYLVVGEAEGVPPGVYAYQPQPHALMAVAEGDRLQRLSDAALSQGWIARASAVIVLGAAARRTTRKYGRRGHRYVHMEVGHAAQNVYLQAMSLGLGTTMVGAFHDEQVRDVLEMADDVEPLCLLPIGRPR